MNSDFQDLKKGFFEDNNLNLAQDLAKVLFQSICKLSSSFDSNTAFKILEEFRILYDTLRKRRNDDYLETEHIVVYYYSYSILKTIDGWKFYDRSSKEHSKRIVNLLLLLEDLYKEYDLKNPSWNSNTDSGTCAFAYGESIHILLGSYGLIKKKDLRRKYMNRLIEIYRKHNLVDHYKYTEFLTPNIFREISIQKSEKEFLITLLEELVRILDANRLVFNYENLGEALHSASQSIPDEDLPNKIGHLILEARKIFCDIDDSIWCNIELGWLLERIILSFKKDGKIVEAKPFLHELQEVNKKYDDERLRDSLRKAKGA